MKRLTIGAFLVGCSLFSSNAQQPATSAPDRPVTFAVLADPQLGMYAKDKDFLQETANLEFVIANLNRLHPDFVVICGDLTNRTGDQAEIAAYKEMLRKLDPSMILAVDEAAEVALLLGCGGNRTEDYGLIWMIQSPAGTRILVLAGLSSAGTAGVGEFFSDPERMKAVDQQLRAAAGSGSFPDSWQVLLRIQARQDVPVSVTPVAVRITRQPRS